MTPLTCAEMHDLAPELALGLLTGPERAAALAHLEGCAPCRSDVASLTDVGEAVLALAPEVPPSAGFETRVLARIGPSRTEGSRPPGPRRWARPATAAAALVLAVAAVAGGLAVAGRDGGGDGGTSTAATDTTGTDAADTSDAPSAPGGEVAAAADLRTESGRVVGRASVSDTAPATVTVEMNEWLDDLRRYGRIDGHSWWLRVGSRGGGEESYALPLAESDPWHVRLDGDEPAGAVASVAVVDETGRAWCEARFAAGGD